MIKFNNLIPDDKENKWRYQMDQFVEDHQVSLAALSWGLRQEWGENSQEVLGIDLQPNPHFICCPWESLETLNHKVQQKIQEILGILDRHNPEQEVAMIGIGAGQVKLIYFKPEPSPPDCFERIEANLDSLIEHLEEKMLEYFVNVE